MSNHYQLRTFTTDELIFNEQETLDILKFFFIKDHALVDSLTMSDHLRGFAQAILLLAIDLSYNVGYLKSLLQSTANPTQIPTSILKKFAKHSALHWFKHAKANDLQNIRIFIFIKNRIALATRAMLANYVAHTNFPQPQIIVLNEHNLPSSPKILG